MLEADTEIEVNNLVREYLAFAEYPASLSSFDSECSKKGRPGSSSIYSKSSLIADSDLQLDARTEEIMNRFLIAFNDGNRTIFFELWDKTFPEAVRNADPLFSKMEFTFSIYFAIFPIHPNVRPVAQKNYTLEKAMEALKVYLSTRGSNLCKTTQFLSFYALPYVPDPTQHPSFKDLFQVRWIEEIEERLKSFLLSALKKRDKPRLMKILEVKDVKMTEDYQHLRSENKSLKVNIRNLEEKESEILQKHRNLQTDYHNLIMIAAELVQTLASSVNGEKITATYLSSICQRLASFKKTGRVAANTSEEKVLEKKPLLQPILESVDSQSNVTKIERTEVALTNKNKPWNKLIEYLDVEKLSEEFNFRSNDGKEFSRRSILLLEALSNHLSNIKNTSEKNSTINGIIYGDLFKINSPKSIIEEILQSHPTIARHQLSRLLNVITSTSEGRAYLLGQHPSYNPTSTSARSRAKTPENIIRNLTNALIEEGLVDSTYKQNLLATLQKLSLRRYAQTAMIRLGIIGHIHELLENFTTGQLSEYTIEYGSSLLMNVCLRKTGRAACLDLVGGGEVVSGRRTLRLLCDLIRLDNRQVKTYAATTLFNILSEPALRDEAREMGVEDVLDEIKNDCDDRFLRQVQFILQLMGKNEDEEEEEDDRDDISEDGNEEDFDDEDQTNEDYVDQKDFIDTLATPGELHGEGLLSIFKTLKNGHHQNIAPKFGGGPKNYKNNNVRSSTTSLSHPMLTEMRRPKTPSSAASTRPSTPNALPKAARAAGRDYEYSSEEEDEIIEPMRLNNVPKTESEFKDFNTGFSTRSKIVRTPEVTSSTSALPDEMREARIAAQFVRSSVGTPNGMEEIRSAKNQKINHC